MRFCDSMPEMIYIHTCTYHIIMISIAVQAGPRSSKRKISSTVEGRTNIYQYFGHIFFVQVSCRRPFQAFTHGEQRGRAKER